MNKKVKINVKHFIVYVLRHKKESSVTYKYQNKMYVAGKRPFGSSNVSIVVTC